MSSAFSMMRGGSGTLSQHNLTASMRLITFFWQTQYFETSRNLGKQKVNLFHVTVSICSFCRQLVRMFLFCVFWWTGNALKMTGAPGRHGIQRGKMNPEATTLHVKSSEEQEGGWLDQQSSRKDPTYNNFNTICQFCWYANAQALLGLEWNWMWHVRSISFFAPGV